MKTLANCDPVEFMVQTNKIRKAVKEWLTLTKIMEIRKRVPKPAATAEGNEEALRRQSSENLNAMLDAMMEEHPVETAELLGMMCFIEPEDLKNHKMVELLGAFAELISTREVLDFFISLTQLGKMDIFATAKG